MIGDWVSSLPAHPERGFIAGLFLLAAGAWLVVWRLARPRRRRPARVVSAHRPRPRRRPDATPFTPRLDDATRVIPGQPDLTEVFPAAAFPDPWGAGVRRG